MNFHDYAASLSSRKYHGDVSVKIYYFYMMPCTDLGIFMLKIIVYSCNTNGLES